MLYIRCRDSRDHLHLTSGRQEVGGKANLALKRRSRGEIAAPICVGVVSQGEDIVAPDLPLRRILESFGVFGIGVVRRGGIESDHWAACRGVHIDVVNDLVQIVKPVIGVLVLEVAAAGPHLVLALREVRLAER